MAHKVFISHATPDRAIAEIVKKTILDVSNHTIQPWFSSDIEADGGFAVGSRWFDDIIKNLAESEACICLITRTGMGSSWIPFEAGVSAGKEMGTYVIPLNLLPDMTDVPSPLKSWQIYQYDNLKKANEFYGKLLRAYGQVYSDSAHGPKVQATVDQIGLLSKSIHPVNRRYTARVVEKRPQKDRYGNDYWLLKLDGLISPEHPDYPPPMEYRPDENHWLQYSIKEAETKGFPNAEIRNMVCFTIKDKGVQGLADYRHTVNARNIYPERLWVLPD